MSRIYAEKTQVSVARSKAEIEEILTRYGATGYVNGWNDAHAAIGFQMRGKSIRFLLPLPKLDAFKKKKNRWGHMEVVADDKAYQAYEQACRSKWRSLCLCIKAKLEAVQAGITSFEHEFLAHFIVNGQQTVGDVLIPQLEDMQKTGKMPPLLLGV